MIFNIEIIEFPSETITFVKTTDFSLFFIILGIPCLPSPRIEASQDGGLARPAPSASDLVEGLQQPAMQAGRQPGR